MKGQLYYHAVVTLPLYLVLCTGFAGMFRKAGIEVWKAFVPILNLIAIIDMIGRPRKWMIWFFIPVINMIFGISLALDIIRSFGKHKFHSHILAVVFPFIYFLWVGWNKKDKYIGKWHQFALVPADKRERNWEKKWNFPVAATQSRFTKEARDWGDAILFAATAAIIIRTFLIEAFMIPTTSMEGSLKAGDFLFVSKFHYGVRLPMIPLSIPFVHNTFPFSTQTRSYLDWITLPYARTPGLRDVERYDIVVFNYPDDDDNADNYTLGRIPETSMKQNYIKRCVGIPGDTLEVRDQQLYINGKPGWNPEKLQHRYLIWDPKGNLSEDNLKERGFRIDYSENPQGQKVPDQNNNAIYLGSYFSKIKNHYVEATRNFIMSFGLSTVFQRDSSKIEGLTWILFANQETIQTLRNDKLPAVTIIRDTLKVIPELRGSLALFREIENGRIEKIDGITYHKSLHFPKAPNLFSWTEDQFGPLYLPRAGDVVDLNPKTAALYRKVIGVYEGHKFEEKAGKYYVDDAEVKSYTFEMNYYFMMGDNRHQSADGRFWGFVPEDHIVGRPLLVLGNFYDKNRWFTGIGGLEPQ